MHLLYDYQSLDNNQITDGMHLMAALLYAAALLTGNTRSLHSSPELADAMLTLNHAQVPEKSHNGGFVEPLAKRGKA